MESKELLCFSHFWFDEFCKKKGYDDSNVPNNIAFISITGTKECQDYYLEEKEEHWFKESHPNVLNVEFDDLPCDFYDWKGHRFFGLSMEQAKDIVDFIERNLGKNFWIHCRAGQSRSQGIVRFILDCYPDYEWITSKDNPCDTPNIDVVAKLKRIWRGNVL